jgi:CHASE3 domain
LRSALQSAESSQRGFLVGGNEIYLAPYGNAKTQALALFDRLKASLAPSSQTDRMIKRLTDVVAEKFDEMDRTIALKSDLRDADALVLFRSNRGKARLVPYAVWRLFKNGELRAPCCSSCRRARPDPFWLKPVKRASGGPPSAARTYGFTPSSGVKTTVKFPVLTNKLPVPQNIFTVRYGRELLEKWP